MLIIRHEGSVNNEEQSKLLEDKLIEFSEATLIQNQGRYDFLKI